MNKWTLKVLVLTFLSLPLLALADGGVTGSGGGGGTILKDGRRMSVDFFRINPTHSEKNNWKFQGRTYRKSPWPKKFYYSENSYFHLGAPTTHAFYKYPLNQLSSLYEKNSLSQLFVQSDAFQLAASLLINWHWLAEASILKDTSGPVSIAFLQMGFYGTSWRVSSQRSQIDFSNYPLPRAVESARPSLEIAGYFERNDDEHTEGRFPIVIYQTYWDEMGVRSQAATLIHEALRHSQFSYKGDEFFDDIVLQRITALISSCQADLRLLGIIEDMFRYGKFSEFPGEEFIPAITPYCSLL